jgi:hypothetical protein
MLNRVREAVSADRRRFKDAEFNLDLSYVTPRIIAMAIPSEGLQATYRNHMDDVDAFLRRDHGENFMIWNLSEFSYDAKFSDKVIHLPFPDHHPPPLDLYFKLVEMIDNWLRADENHVAVVHCKGGKGRTGTIVVSLLFFRGECATVDEAEKLFASMRSSKAKGVTQPSQRRYIQYFKTVLVRDSLINFQPVRLRSVTIAPLLSERPILLQVFNGVTDDAELLFSQMRDPIPFGGSTSMVKYTIELDVRGDLYFKVFRRRDKDKVERAFHVVMHSYFISSPQYILERKDLDHLKSSDRRFSDDLTVTFQFATPQTARFYTPSDDLHNRMSKKYHDSFPNSVVKRRETESISRLTSDPSISSNRTTIANGDSTPRESRALPTTVQQHPLISTHIKAMLENSDSLSSASPSPGSAPILPLNSSTNHQSLSPRPPSLVAPSVDKALSELEMAPPDEPPPMPPMKSPRVEELVAAPTSGKLYFSDSSLPKALEGSAGSTFKAALEPQPPSIPVKTLGQFRKSRRDLHSQAIRRISDIQEPNGQPPIAIPPTAANGSEASFSGTPTVSTGPKRPTTTPTKVGWAVGTPTSGRSTRFTLRGSPSALSASGSDFSSESHSSSSPTLKYVAKDATSPNPNPESPRNHLINLSYDDLPTEDADFSDSSSDDSSDSEEYLDLDFVQTVSTVDAPVRSQSEKIFTRAEIPRAGRGPPPVPPKPK